MIEIYNIIFQLIIFFIIFSFPINSSFLNNTNFKYCNIYEIFFMNFIIFSTLGLFFSINNLDNDYLFYFFCICGLTLFILNFNRNKKKIFNIFFSSFVILLILIFFQIASYPILQWDGLATWSIKMNNFYFGQNYMNLENAPYKHQPNLGPYLWALFYENSFLNYEYIGRFFYVFIFISSVFSLKSNFKINKDYFITLLFILIAYLSYDPYLFGGYQEYLIFSLILYSSNFLYKILNQSNINTYELIIFSLTLNLILWSKQEGIAYIFILQFIFILLKQPTNLQKLISIFLFFSIIYIKLKFSFNDVLDDPHFDFKNIINFDFGLLIYKIIFITKHIFICFIKYPVWLLIIPSYFFIISANNISVKFLKIVNVFALLNVVLIYFVFLTTIADFEWLVKVTLDRMVFQTTGFYIILILICLDKVLLNKKIN